VYCFVTFCQKRQCEWEARHSTFDRVAYTTSPFHFPCGGCEAFIRKTGPQVLPDLQPVSGGNVLQGSPTEKMQVIRKFPVKDCAPFYVAFHLSSL